jgi:hypothetical protein
MKDLWAEYSNMTEDQLDRLALRIIDMRSIYLLDEIIVGINEDVYDNIEYEGTGEEDRRVWA